MIRHAPSNELTQGTIFTCAIAGDYKGVSVCGLVVTARCDLTHGKAPIISYIPLVPFEAWLLRDGGRILAARVVASANSGMKSAIKDAGMVDSVLQTLPHTLISDELNRASDKPGRTIAKRFDDALLARKEAEFVLTCLLNEQAVKDFISSQQKLYNQVAKELLSNGIADFHYIERSEPDESCQGYVALLREIRFMPTSLALALLNGIDYGDFGILCTETPSLADNLSIFSKDHYAMPIGLLMSPFIELLMQRFTQLFARIGVIDFTPERLNAIKALVPFEKVRSE